MYLSQKENISSQRKRQDVPEWIALFYVIKAIFYLICIMIKHPNNWVRYLDVFYRNS